MASYPHFPSTPRRKHSSLDGIEYPITPATPHKLDKERQYEPIRAVQGAKSLNSIASNKVHEHRVQSGRISKPKSILKGAGKAPKVKTAKHVEFHFEDILTTPKTVAPLMTPLKRSNVLPKIPKSLKPYARTDREPTTPKTMAEPSLPPAAHACDTLDDNGSCTKCAGFYRGHTSTLAIRSYYLTRKTSSSSMAFVKEGPSGHSSTSMH
jgi:hypothetical protein